MGKSTIKRKSRTIEQKNTEEQILAKNSTKKKNDEKSGWDIANIHIEYCTLCNLQKKYVWQAKSQSHRKYSIYMKRRSYSSAHRAQMLRIRTKIVEICRFTSNFGNSNLCAEEECFSDLKIVGQIWYEFIFLKTEYHNSIWYITNC